jgi:hypothetical protein
MGLEMGGGGGAGGASWGQSQVGVNGQEGPAVGREERVVCVLLSPHTTVLSVGPSTISTSAVRMRWASMFMLHMPLSPCRLGLVPS